MNNDQSNLEYEHKSVEQELNEESYSRHERRGGRGAERRGERGQPRSGHHQGDHHKGGYRGGRPRGEGHRRNRLFDYGELRILLLAMIGEKSAHGYELMRQIEERFAGQYVPSPGVMYPTLAWTEDMGYTEIAVAENGKKQYSLTSEGSAFLQANRQLADELLIRTFKEDEGSKTRRGNPQLREALDRLRHVVKSKIRHQGDEDVSAKILQIVNETITRIEIEFPITAGEHDE
ncbi:PadR family transcriptional regulator [Bartonella sp. HY329]|uniref:PadR family transcriptional regulator n=1 Tax=unclassified Bartonella TaxID=2645622 RepID=UPI0021C606BF|nr:MULTISPECIES: PadR family transcriptional regulator [unclassified Bartonella]UXM94151.1 PadR family transcriptional regulator [Bartonella sp. HY329]UXN08473.1 PadR family transcriptional regulator [Bartonella sp. HY328]